MAALKYGTASVAKLMYGAAEALKAYYGSELVWEAEGEDPGPTGPVDITYTDDDLGTTAEGVRTTGALAIGSEAEDRWIYLTITTSVDLGIPSAVTVGGVSADKVAEQLNTNAAPDTAASIWRVSMPTGTTAVVVVTVGTATHNVGITVLRVVGGTGEIHDTDGANDNGDTTVDVVAGGGVIAVICFASNANVTWTGATEVTDFDHGSRAHATAIHISAEPISGHAIVTNGGSGSAACTVSIK